MTETTAAPAPDQVRKALALELPDNDSMAPTVIGYLTELLLAAWESGDDVTPWGNSGWQYELYRPLLAAGFAGGLTEAEEQRLNEGWGIPGPKQAELDALILAAIRQMGQLDDAEGDDERPGYWQVRTALRAAVDALQHVALGTDGRLAAKAREALAKVDAALQPEPADQLAAPQAAPEHASAVAATVAEIDVHRWYAIISQPDGTTTVIGVQSHDGLGHYGSVAEWEAANS